MKNIITNIIFGVLIGIICAAIVAIIGMEVYAWLYYGNKPITEIPYWAIVIMGK